MLKIGFVVTPGFPIMSLAAISVFEFANLNSDEPLYSLQILSEHGGPVRTPLGTPLHTEAFGDTHFDTLIIGGNTEYVKTSPALIDFIKEVAKTSRRLSSICTGVFALAEAGQVEGRRVTTHWLFTDELRTRAPGVRLDEDKIYVIDGHVWTAAGNSAGVDLALAMLERDHGAELARTVAKIMVVDQQRAGGQSQHSALLDMNPKSDRVQDALAFSRKNLAKPISVEDMAQAARLGPRQFSRAFRTETGMSPAKAVESLRIEAARLMLEQTRHPIDLVARETGFGDEERMRRAFLRVLGHPRHSCAGPHSRSKRLHSGPELGFRAGGSVTVPLILLSDVFGTYTGLYTTS